MDTLAKRGHLLSIRSRLLRKRATIAVNDRKTISLEVNPVTKASGCSSCGKKISLDPLDEDARKRERARIARMRKGNYRSIGLATMEPQHLKR